MPGFPTETTFNPIPSCTNAPTGPMGAVRSYFPGGAGIRLVSTTMLLLGALAVLVAVQVARASGPILHIDLPSQVDAGEPIALTLTVQNAADIAGYETTLLFNATVAHVRSLDHASALGLPQQPLVALGPVESNGGVTVGAYTCFAAICRQWHQARPDQGALATVTLVSDQPGVLEIKLAHTRFVDANGHPLQVLGSEPTLSVRVGPPQAGPHHPAPAWRPVSPLRPHPALARPPLIDLTGDRRLTYADVMEVALTWMRTRAQGRHCTDLADPRHDLNADGCIDIADLQLIAGSAGPKNTSHRSAPYAGNPAMPELPNRQYLPYVSATRGLTLTVNAVTDEADANIADGLCATAAHTCTLRAAIEEANAHPGADTIAFNLPGAGIQTIQLTRRLPTLSDMTGGTTIDGYTQPGSAPNQDPLVSQARILVQVTGTGSAAFNGLAVTSSGNAIRGLSFFNLRTAIEIYGNTAHDNEIAGNFIGTDAAGTFVSATSEAWASGIVLEQGASRNRIGGPTPAQRNIISGNPWAGIALYHSGTNGNVIVNNIIGLGPGGDERILNHRHGVDVNFGASANIIGGFEPGEGNIISGNGWAGVEISHGTNTVENQVLGNLIGTDVTGSHATLYSFNGDVGVSLDDGVSQNIVAGNIIGNNRAGGIYLAGNATRGNHLYGNRIGISRDGSAIPHSSFGIEVRDGASHTLIGPDNLIVNNFVGVQIAGNASDFNTITRNSIFANATLGIDLYPAGVTVPGGSWAEGPNQQLAFPSLMAVTPVQVVGSACLTCTVEIFVADRFAAPNGQGKQFLGSAPVAQGGIFTATIGGVALNDFITATATDAAGNTSEFSYPVRVDMAHRLYLPHLVLPP